MRFRSGDSVPTKSALLVRSSVSQSPRTSPLGKPRDPDVRQHSHDTSHVPDTSVGVDSHSGLAVVSKHGQDKGGDEVQSHDSGSAASKPLGDRPEDRGGVILPTHGFAGRHPTPLRVSSSRSASAPRRPAATGARVAAASRDPSLDTNPGGVKRAPLPSREGPQEKRRESPRPPPSVPNASDSSLAATLKDRMEEELRGFKASILNEVASSRAVHDSQVALAERVHHELRCEVRNAEQHVRSESVAFSFYSVNACFFFLGHD